MRLINQKTVAADTGVEDIAYVTGDWHMGDGSAADDFAPRALLFSEFGREVGFDNIVAGGDNFEGWQSSQKRIWDTYGDLLSSITRGVHGNHDRKMSRFGPVHPLGNCLIVHGHQADPWNSRYRLVGELATRFAGLLERVVHRDADHWLERLLWRTPAKLSGKRFTRYSERFMRPWAARMLATHPGLSLIHGHDHRAKLCRCSDGRFVANWGTWSRNPVHVIRLRPGLVQLVRVEP